MSDQRKEVSISWKPDVHWALIALSIVIPWIGILLAVAYFLAGLVKDGTQYLKVSKALFLWAIFGVLMWFGLALLLANIPFVGTWNPSRP